MNLNELLDKLRAEPEWLANYVYDQTWNGGGSIARQHNATVARLMACVDALEMLMDEIVKHNWATGEKWEVTDKITAKLATAIGEK